MHFLEYSKPSFLFVKLLICEQPLIIYLHIDRRKFFYLCKCYFSLSPCENLFLTYKPLYVYTTNSTDEFNDPSS